MMISKINKPIFCSLLKSTHIKEQIKLTLDKINKRIEKEYCNKTFNELTDERLIDEYKKSLSTKKKIDKIDFILTEENIEYEKKKKLLKTFLPISISPGTKGVIRGIKFNKIVKKKINNINLDTERFDICFEKNYEKYSTNEIPDWYILEKSSNKTIIGMNQIDLWSGGHQINRGSKYIFNNQYDNKNSKLLCVVCNKIQLRSNKNKTFKLFREGFENNTLCYLNNLQNIIYSFFNLK